MSLRYMTGESRIEEERYHCPRCNVAGGYICADHREPSYQELKAQVERARMEDTGYFLALCDAWRAATSNEECANLLRLYCTDGKTFWKRYGPKKLGEE